MTNGWEFHLSVKPPKGEVMITARLLPCSVHLVLYNKAANTMNASLSCGRHSSKLLNISSLLIAIVSLADLSLVTSASGMGESR